MKLELLGNRYSIELQGIPNTYERAGGDGNCFVYDYKYWSGVGIVSDLDKKSPRTFDFMTESGRDNLHGTFEKDVLCTSYLAHGKTFEELPVISREKVIDWLAEKIILALEQGNEIKIPHLDAEELVCIGALCDPQGQVHMALA